jgi:hypothetical protein
MLKQALLISTLLLVQNSFFAQSKTTTKPAAKTPVKTNNAQPLRLSQFERALESDLLIDKNNTLHVVFQESSNFGKPIFIYYTSSSNNGASWSKPITISNDETGNGAGSPSIIQDGNGVIYAIWKRYGNKGSKYAAPEVTLDGRGGFVNGTLFYKVLQGGQWSQQYQISEEVGSQFSWFPFINNKGQLYVCWNEVSPESLKSNWLMWYYADWIRFGMLSPTGVTARAEIAKPSAPTFKGGAPPENGVINLHGYADKEGNVHFIYNKKDPDKIQRIYYYDGKKYESVYSYPLYKEGNNFMNPPRLLYDENGVDHVVFVPSSSNLESEQLWDITAVDKKRNVLASIQKKGVSIYNFQASQGPDGKMNAVLHVGGVIDSKEAYGFFYEAGKWEKRGLTKNAAKNNFIYAELTPRTYLTTLTTYSSQHSSVGYTKDGNKKMTMTLSAYWSAGAYSVNNPSIIFMNLD